MTMAAVVLGFALLTVGMVTGVVRWLNGTHVPVGKITLSSLAWLAYAIVLHAPINPRFRGRKAAMLSIFGFALMIATLVAVQIVGASKL
jgi:ABC-type transport system involved in cytochrome c biogenesis permease subunit